MLACPIDGEVLAHSDHGTLTLLGDVTIDGTVAVNCTLVCTRHGVAVCVVGGRLGRAVLTLAQ